MNDHRKYNANGFTLVELLVAVVLVGILTAVAIVGFGGVMKSGNNASCKAMLESSKAAAATYYANQGAYPKTTGAAPIGFAALTTATSGIAPVLSVPSGVTVAGNVMNSGTSWSITIAGGGANIPNTFTKTSGGAACS